MKHSIGYLGHFERDFTNLCPGKSEYVREDGSLGKIDERPENVDGVFFGYLECKGREFVAVRARYGELDVFLKKPVPLIPTRHTDGKGFGPKPARFGDESAARLLADMIDANPSEAPQLKKIVERTELGVPS